jgi:hypothetical protein
MSPRRAGRLSHLRETVERWRKHSRGPALNRRALTVPEAPPNLAVVGSVIGFGVVSLFLVVGGVAWQIADGTPATGPTDVSPSRWTGVVRTGGQP